MRVYEYAKEHNVSSKDVLDTLKKQNIELKNHMAVLTDEALKVLKPAAPKAPASAAIKPASAPAKPSATPSPVPIKPAPSAPAKPIVAAPKTNNTTNNRNSTAKKKGGSKKGDGRPTPQRDLFRQSRETVVTKSNVEAIEVVPDMLVSDVALLLEKPVTEVIFVLLKKGIVRNINNTLTIEEVNILGETFEVVVAEKSVAKEDALVAKKQQGGDKRLPVVVVMGHVDHGKTTLLDYLRKANVADREKGGITQHLGAYEVSTGSDQRVIFLDTPGHEAFSYMRSRGTRVTDIAIVIIAANDGIKPQTVEAIELAKKAGVPIVVAINKIDKIDSESQLDTIRTQLAQHDLTPEEWGGETVCVPISAKTGKGVDTLLEMLALHAEMLDLKTKIDSPARAFVLETKQVKGQGWAATVICREGTLRRGDFFVCGSATGKVRLLIDSFDKQTKEVGPSVPVQVIGFDSVEGLGDYLEVVSQSDYTRAKTQKHFKAPSLSVAIAAAAQQGDETPAIRLICKADMQGSAQAILEAITKMSKNEKNSSVKIELLGCDIGPIGESDVIRAIDTGAHLFGLHVKAERNAQLLAKEKNIEIYTHSIIYHLLEQIEEMVKVERQKIVHLVPSGSAEVLKVFPVKNRRVIAGCMINEGLIKPGDKVICLRGREEIGSGIVTSLQRDRKESKEVHEGNDCGFLTDSFHAWEPGDKVQILTHQRDED